MGDRLRLSSDVLKAYTGDGDVVRWLAKLKMVARLQKIEDVATLIPLYLEGNALSVYLEMNEAEQADADFIEARLKTAFAESAFDAYSQLRRITWTGEPVDVFATEIRRLAGLAGYAGMSLEKTVKMTFVTGLPDSVSTELQRLTMIETMNMDEVLTHARVLTKKRPQLEAAASARTIGGKSAVKENLPWGRSPGKAPVKCFRCQGPHLIKDCKEPQPGITCYRCSHTGHISRYCDAPRDQGNE